MVFRKRLYIGFFVFALVCGLYVGYIIYGSISSPAPKIVPSRQITHNSSDLGEIWRTSDVWLPLTGPNLETGDSTVVIANHDPNASLHYFLQALSTESGHQLWEVDLPQRIGIDSLLAKDAQLFVGLDGEIQAYGLINGQLLWQTPGKPVQRTSYELAWLNGNLVNYSTVLNEDYSLMSVYSPSTGKLLQQEKISEIPLLTTTNTEYRGGCGRLLAYDIASQELKWQTSLSGCPQHRPAVIDSSLLVATYPDYGSIAGLHLIDAINGRLMWYALEDDVVSNFAIINGVVYVIRRNGSMVGIDLNTGQEVGTIQFNANQNQTDPSQNAYWLASNGHQLLAYFGDSRELIAFQH